MAIPGSSIGEVLGGLLGSAVAPGVGTAAGASIGAGIGNLFDASKINPVTPPATDPRQEEYNSEIQAIRNGQGRNTGVAYREALRQLRIGQADTMKKLMESAGGSSGALINGVTALNDKFGDQAGKVFAQGQQEGDRQQDFYGTMENGAVKDDAATKASLDMLKYGQDYVNKANLVKSGNSQFGAGVANGLMIPSTKGPETAQFLSKVLFPQNGVINTGITGPPTGLDSVAAGG